MSASEFNEQTDTVFKHVEQIVSTKGVAIKLTLNGSALKLEFADGQRILITHDTANQKIWLAALFAGTEYLLNNGNWTSLQDGSELYSRLGELIDQLIRSNPVNSQRGNYNGATLVRPQFERPTAAMQETHSSPFKFFALLAILAWLGYAAFQHSGRTGNTDGSFMAAIDNMADNKCDGAFPQNGASYIFPASKIQPNNPADTDISLSNDHSHSFLAIFTAPKSVIPYLSVLVQPGQTAKIKLPPGQYDLMFSVGNTWCNTRTGFSDGQHIKLNTTMTVLAEQPIQMGAQSSGTGAADFQIFIKSTAPETPPPPTQFVGEGVMEVRQHQDGHYHIEGTLNGYPVTYLIDTGASITSLTTDTANRVGVLNCKAASFKTANGAVSGCIGRVAQFTIGNYQMQNATVAVMPNMEVDLLGMNVLSHFQISQANATMRLSSR